MHRMIIIALTLAACSKGGSGETDHTDLPEPTFCETQGLTDRPWVEPSEGGHDLYSPVEDLHLDTTDGEIVLSELWTGCDTFVFVQDEPRQADQATTPVWDRDVAELFAASPANVHYFFLSADGIPGLQSEVDDALADMDTVDAEWWRARVHYIAEAPYDQPGWLGDAFDDYGWGFGIDRFQKLRFVGSYGDPERYDSQYGWFRPNLSMVANEPRYWNYESDRQDRLDAENATVVTVFDGDTLSDGGWAGIRGSAQVAMPDVDAFDTLEMDLHLGCVGDGEFGECPAWDYLVDMWLCTPEETSGCSQEVGRFITTYHRDGRWIADMSPLLPLFAGGGTRTIEFDTQQPYETELSLRFSNHGKPTKAVQAIPLFRGGAFDAEYNSRYLPIDVEIPASAQRVEIATLITGHGGAQPGNCAEFCATEHTFTVGSTEFERVVAEEAGNEDGCMQQIEQGTIPNQYGTWWYGRSGWCPGKQVDLVNLDVTSAVTAGGTATVAYRGTRNGEAYESGGANIDMSSWLVVYE